MKCTKCGAEQEADVKFCTQCGAPMEQDNQTPEDNGPDPAKEEPAAEAEAVKEEEPAAEAEAVKAEEPAAEAETVKEEEPVPTAVTVPAEPQPNKKFIKVLSAVVAIAAVIAVAALAYVKMATKDPKQVVIEAFENVFPEGQVYPSEELFGLKDFAETVKTADSQGGLTLKMDSCSDETVNAYAGSGLRFQAKDDKTNGRSFFNMGVIYSGMDLANLNAYYGDDTLMLAIPELSGKVFTVDLGDGLADRIKNSPTVGPLLEQNGVDVEGMAAYFTELMDEAEKVQTEGKQPFDMEALINRYKEGCKAQENFKAALTVEKADKGTYTMDGAQVSCKG
ncbi:MAG: zinc ribbon domain-containing protein, partial [Enterocloster clostridioformis]|nr:zinc ribbon domain-containing protein [Enterocloster clostridioformis]